MKIISTSIFLVALNLGIFAQSSGSLDTSFDPGTGTNTLVESIAVQADGKILIGGPFNTYNGTSINGIARLNSDGSIDSSFDPGTGIQGIVAGQQYHVYDIAIQSDGKIILVGGFNNFNDVTANDIVRLNSDGSIDPTFDPGTATGDGNEVINCVSIQSDGKIVIGGSFDNFNGLSGVNVTNKITRLNTDGSVDASFDEGSGANLSIRDLAIQSDDKIVIVGDFTSYNGTTYNKVARINSDGSLDTDYNTGTGSGGTFPSTRAVKIQSDGKVIISGDFDSFNGTTRGKIARLNTDGTLDTSFDPGTGADLNAINKIEILSDGDIIICGGFYNYDGNSRNSIARINSDGSIDTDFDPGFGCNNTGEAIAVQTDGKILIGGNFTSYDGTQRDHIARINNQEDVLSVSELINDFELLAFPNPSSGMFQVSSSVQDLELRIVSIDGTVVRDWTSSKMVDLGNMQSGVYLLETNYGKTIRIIKN